MLRHIARHKCLIPPPEMIEHTIIIWQRTYNNNRGHTITSVIGVSRYIIDS